MEFFPLRTFDVACIALIRTCLTDDTPSLHPFLSLHASSPAEPSSVIATLRNVS